MDPIDNETAQRQALTVAWQPELADFVDMFRLRNRARRAWRKIAILSGIMVLFIVAGIVADEAGAVGVGIGGLLTIVLMLAVVQPFTVRNAWRRNPALRSPAEVRVDPHDGVTSSNGGSTGQYPWSGIDSFLESDRLFLIQLAGYRRMPVLVVAKRGLTDPAQVAELRSMLTAGIASARTVAG